MEFGTIRISLRFTQMKKQIHTDFLYSDLTFKCRKAIFTVYNTLGFGHKEKVYQEALVQEFEELQIPYKKEFRLPVYYKSKVVGSYRPDFVIDNKIIIELKAVEFIPQIFEQQLLHYLKSTHYKLGLLVNFGNQKIYIRRLIWSESA